MSGVPTSYVLCGTPRSGSTLLCAMLSATGVAGRPNSYFRREDIPEWADAWGVPHPNGVDTPDFDRAYLDAMKREGSAGTGVFGLRLMWGSVTEAAERLDRAAGTKSDIAQSLSAWFGQTLYVHVSRLDKVAQAVSLTRAEQSGLWHLAADGTVLEGVEKPRPASYDGRRIAAVVQNLERDDEAWNTFFEQRGIASVKLVYETVTADPHAALRDILTPFHLDRQVIERVGVPTARMADEESARWIERFRREFGA